jgi:hypothetical protein
VYTGRFVRWSGAAAMVGGLLWSLFAVLASLKPMGCIAETCSHRPMRDTSELAPLMIAAALLLLVGFIGLVVHARRTARIGWLMKLGVVVALAGAGVLAVALFVQAVFFAGDFPAMPTLVIPGGVALALGVLTVGFAVLRLMPRWVGILLVAGATTLIAANDQDARVLLYIPFGLSWLAVGWMLRSETRGQVAGRSLSTSPR